MGALSGIEPKKVWEIFEGICQVPRPSKKEEKIIAYLEDWAKKHNFKYEKDDIGNLIIRKPATKGMENKKPVCVQGHVDMVTVKNSDTVFDFDNDSIEPYVDGDWVKAKGTTLGADNGIGLAMGMAVMESDDIPHPDFELLCTLDEETGLTGAIQLGTNLMKAEMFINLDSEDWGHFTIGCAGGCDAEASIKYIAAPDACTDKCKSYKLDIKGLKGGHSGIEIHDGRGNAIKFLNRLLYNLQSKFDICLSSIDGGSKHNAIPHEAIAVVGVSAAKEAEFKAYIEEFTATLKNEYGSKEPGMQVIAEPCETPARCMDPIFARRLVKTFYAMPHGVYRWSPDMEGFPQTSLNFAIVETRDDEILVLTSQRSSINSEKYELADKVKATLELIDAEVEIGGGYPAWPPNTDSKILDIGKKVYKDLFGEEVVIEAIHAGLECGLIGEKYPGTDMISFGPTLEEVHTPNERCDIPSTEKCYKLLCELLKNIPDKD